jgi:Domain of unknown function (DUF4263)
MPDEKEGAKPVFRRTVSGLRPGEPIQVSDPIEVTDATQSSPLCAAMVQTLKAYSKAARELIAGQYASVRDLAPPHLRVPCHTYVICCPDGVLVRYDAAGEDEPKVRYIDYHESLAEVAPNYSEQVIHVPDDPATYVPQHDGPSFSQIVINERGEEVEIGRLHPVIYAPKSFPADFNLPSPPARPPCLASLHREFQIQMRGEVLQPNMPARAIPAGTDRFVAHGLAPLNVGWQAVEIYPLLDEAYWRPEYAGAWAQLDLLSAITQRNLVKSALHSLDGRRDARERYAKLLEQFEALLAGPEEPCHQFLKANPEILCTTHDAAWSKVRFGEHVSDFVFREPSNDYLLVEIEAPHRELFRKDGHPRQTLTHAMSQIDDWLAYIHENKGRVERELDLLGISATPRTLVVIGRSASLTEDNRRTLAVLQSQRPRLTIMTYDDLLDRARANLERHFGPLSIRAQNLDIYFYRADSK